MANLVVIAGNGLTIDFCNHFKLWDYIDPTNLFRFGDLVPWPDSENEAGFLSRYHCPNLWNLGARPFMSGSESYNLIEEILTCANAMSLRSSRDSSSPFILAYFELAEYLKHLFVYYNAKVGDQLINERASSWAWIKFLQESCKRYETISIVTYCYDIFLERALLATSMDFALGGLQDASDSKIVIYKPHGSISFCHNTYYDQDAYHIFTSWDGLEAKVDDFNVCYHDLARNYAVNAIIPPAGDTARLREDWAYTIQEKANATVSSVSDQDTLIVTGLSYWHVDRLEIDGLLTRANRRTRVYHINPSPPKTLDSVLCCLFERYSQHCSTDILGERL